jgi:hypothetical protein
MTIQASSPAQRTAGTARAVLMAGLVFALEAIWRGSIARTLMAAAVLIAGAGLLVFARRTAG